MARQKHEGMEKKTSNLSFGITSLCGDGKHIYFGDCDTSLYWTDINKIVKELQSKGLSEILVIQTCNGYNFVAFDKLSLDEIKEINDSIAPIDKEFNKYNYNRGYYTLRMGIDKTFYTMIDDTNKTRPKDNSKSNAHRIFFENMFDIRIKDFWDGAFDNSTWFQTVFYEDTKKRD
jgi:hypothetical protein